MYTKSRTNCQLFQTVHSVETCDQTKILAHNLFKTPLLKAFKKISCKKYCAPQQVSDYYACICLEIYLEIYHHNKT